jgi:hypothetical protein
MTLAGILSGEERETHIKTESDIKSTAVQNEC